MHPVAAVFSFSLLAASVPAQAPPAAAPNRSLADGLVRQVIERDKLTLPQLQAGLELGAGQGPLVLMVRRADGSLELHELQRGAGEHGPAAKPDKVPMPEEQQVVEGKDGKQQAPRPVSDAASIRLFHRGDDLVLDAGKEPGALVGKGIDRARLLPILQAQFAGTRGSVREGQLVLEIEPQVLMQEVLTTWELARAAGFTVLMFSPQGAAKAASAADRELIGGLAERFQWRVERKGPRGRQPVCDGELLIVLDGPVPFGDIAPLIREFAKAGIWQFGFVGQQDARTRCKLPTNLPFDQGM